MNVQFARVPQTADEKDNQRIPHDLPTCASAATERYVNVVAKPCGQRYMPTAPELGNVA